MENILTEAEHPELKERAVMIGRVAKVVKGGKRFGFNSIVVVGDGAGKVGIGLGKAPEVPDAIKKGIEIAKKNLFVVPMKGTTIPYEVKATYGASTVILKPAAPGTGVVAGGPIRALVEMAGIKDILTKSLGSRNAHNVVKAGITALKSLRRVEEVAKIRDKKIEDLITG